MTTGADSWFAEHFRRAAVQPFRRAGFNERGSARNVAKYFQTRSSLGGRQCQFVAGSLTKKYEREPNG